MCCCSARQPHLECTTEDQHNIINPIHDQCTEQFRSLRRHLAQSLTLNITLLYYDTNSGLTEFRIHQKKNKNPQHRWCVAVAFVKALPLCVVNPIQSIYLSLSTAYQYHHHHHHEQTRVFLVVALVVAELRPYDGLDEQSEQHLYGGCLVFSYKDEDYIIILLLLLSTQPRHVRPTG